MIMPLLFEISSEDDDDQGRGNGNVAPSPPPAPSPAGDSGSASPSSEDQQSPQQPSGEAEAPTGTPIESTEPQDTPMEIPSDSDITRTMFPGITKTGKELLKKIGSEDFYALPHTTFIEDSSGQIHGSYDKRFPPLTLPKDSPYVPINPLTNVQGVTKHDFKHIGMDDPRCEDINTIIALGARGNLSREQLNTLRQKEDLIQDNLTPHLYKFVMSQVTTVTPKKLLPFSKVKKRPLMVPRRDMSYEKTGWVGPRVSSLKNHCEPLDPPTFPLKFHRAMSRPKIISKYEAFCTATSLQERTVHQEFPESLLNAHGLSAN